MNHQKSSHRPKLGLQGPVLGFQDPWAKSASDRVMRTGTGAIYPSQDPTPNGKAFINTLKELGAEFYVHHMLPDMSGHGELFRDISECDMQIVLGNEYGNINGPWVEGTNRYDVPDVAIQVAVQTGKLIGLLYDEPEHLAVNAGQYRKDGWYPHWGNTDGMELQQACEVVTQAMQARVDHVRSFLRQQGVDGRQVPLVMEQVFPTMFHVHARAGTTVCPKVMKESFQSLQLATALGAAKQYQTPLWICADLWGPDIGHWFTRISGFPGHSPAEYASALRMGYYIGPSHLFTENVDVLMQYQHGRFSLTEFGEVWQQFAKDFVPQHPLTWDHSQVEADIAIVCSDDSNYGQNERLFGNRTLSAPGSTKSLFQIWHLLSHGTIPNHGSCMHIPGYAFPRQRLKEQVPPESFPLPHGCDELEQTAMHPLFYPTNNVLVFDEFVEEAQLGNPKLIFVTGSRISQRSLTAVRKRAQAGATVLIARWLAPAEWQKSQRFDAGRWYVVDGFQSDDVREIVQPFLGESDCWMQRFGDVEVRMYKADAAGVTLDFDIRQRSSLQNS